MYHSREHSRKSKNSGDIYSWIFIVILLSYAIWVYRSLILVILHYTIIIFLLIAMAVVTKYVIRFSKKIGVLRGYKLQQLAAIDKMDGLEFEKYIAVILSEQGYTNIKLTEKYDLGVDIIAEKNGIRWGIQVKRYSGLVKAEAVRQVVTALNKYKCDQAMVITNSMYSRVAMELAETNNCTLVDRVKLVSWHQ